MVNVTDRLYYRISLDTTSSGSIDKQRATLVPDARSGYIEYEDRSVSGSKIAFKDRPAGGKLMAELEAGDRVLVTKIDRAARNAEDLLRFVREVKEAGADVVFSSPKLSTEGVMGKLTMTIFAALAEFEAAMIAERVRESIAAMKADGRHASGKAPFGLHSVPNPKGRGLVLRPHPEESVLLRSLVRRILDGEMSQLAAADELGMDHTGFGRLLRNPRLAGMLLNGTLDHEQAVFNAAEWEELQAHVQRPEKAWKRHYDFGPVIFCSICSERVYYRHQKTKYGEYDYLHCRGGHVGVPLSPAEKKVSDDFLAIYGEMPVEVPHVSSSSTERQLAVAEARLLLANAQAALVEAEDEFEEESAMSRLREAKKALREAEAIPDETEVWWEDTGEVYADLWERMDVAGKLEGMQRVGARWTVLKGRMPVEEKLIMEPLKDGPFPVRLSD